MKIECVVICVNYSDFLAESLPTNRHQFDRLVVVTTPEDKLTQRLCENYHVHCIQTDVFDTAHGNFRKGAAINVGLAALSRDAWLCHMDADIVLPPKTRRLLEQSQLDPSCIYGADRFMIKSAEEWFTHLQRPKVLHQHWEAKDESGYFILTDNHRFGVRVAGVSGWVPIGFFQLWHSSKCVRYPEGHTTAGREDMLMGMQWPRSKRVLLPEILVYHLESEANSAMGANWLGRTTPTFARPTPNPLTLSELWTYLKLHWRQLVSRSI